MSAAKHVCSCQWCSIRRDMDAAEPATRGWHWARLWRFYLQTVLNSLDAIARGDRRCQATIDETRELAGEHGVDFEKELAAALAAGKEA